MRKIYLFLMLASIFTLIDITTAKAQSEVTSKWYVTTTDLTVSSADTPTAANSYRVKPGTKFTVINISSSNNYEIEFGYFGLDDTQTTSDSSKIGGTSNKLRKKLKSVPIGRYTKAQLTTYPTDSAFISTWSNFMTFYISPKDLSSKCLVYYTKDIDFTWGALTMPLKIRFGNGKDIYSAYEENLNLGLTFGLKFTIPSTKDQSLNALILAGITAVNLDSVSLKDASFYDPKNTSTKAVTCGIGLVYQYSSFQIGAFTGIDHISGQLGREWRHQDRPWLGIGIGLALFNNQSASKGSTPSNSVSP